MSCPSEILVLCRNDKAQSGSTIQSVLDSHLYILKRDFVDEPEESRVRASLGRDVLMDHLTLDGSGFEKVCVDVC